LAARARARARLLFVITFGTARRAHTHGKKKESLIDRRTLAISHSDCIICRRGLLVPWISLLVHWRW
jgi:hypothetical protein